MHYLEDQKGITWHYEIEGDGPPVLFIHGWGVDSRIWRQQFKFFSQSCRVIAVDMPGHGETTWQPVCLEDLVNGIQAVLAREKIQGARVVASSFGGLVALKLYALFPELLGSLVLVGSQPKFLKSADYPYGLEQAQLDKLAGQLVSSYPSIVNVFFRSIFTREERASRRFKWIQTFRKAASVPNRDALLNFLRILGEEDLRDVLPRLDVPVFYLNGAQDYFFPEALSEYLQQKIPRVRFEWFKDCGHFPFLSFPHEFNEVLKRSWDEIAVSTT